MKTTVFSLARALQLLARMRGARPILFAIGLPMIAACNSMYAPGPPSAETITVRVFGDPDEPVEGAEIGSGAGTLGRTDATGVARFKLEGADGTRFDLGVTCPANHGGGAARPLKIVLRRGSKAPEYTASCRRTMRSVVVAVKAVGVSGLPVMHLGRELARLDDAGMALVHLDMKVGDTFTLFLDTTDPKWSALRPQNPEISFQVADADELYNFEPKFHEEHVIVKRAPAAKPHVPKRID